jgi:serine/threonine-protein kinase
MSDGIRIDLKKFIGRELGTVTILSVLGQGGTGTVFLAFQRTLKRQVAVKIMLKSAVMSQADMALFRQEAEIIASLSHPNIIPIFEMGEAEDCFFQVMQIVKGEDLESSIRRNMMHPVPSRRIMAPAEAVPLIVQVLDGLGYAHGEGLVHQDIKPGNILIEERGKRPLIADFGIAKTMKGKTPHDDSVILGTPLYMAPEHAASLPTDRRSDIYSVGVMLFRIMVEKLPLAERSATALLSRKAKAPDSVFTARPSEINQTIPLGLERIILKAMESDPARRYQNCESFKSDLEMFQKMHLS